MHEKRTFSTKIEDKESLRKDEAVQSGKKSSTEDLTMQAQSEYKIVKNVLERKYGEEPYYATGGELRIRIRDEEKSIIYDADFNSYATIYDILGMPLEMEKIQGYITRAKKIA